MQNLQSKSNYKIIPVLILRDRVQYQSLLVFLFRFNQEILLHIQGVGGGGKHSSDSHLIPNQPHDLAWESWIFNKRYLAEASSESAKTKDVSLKAHYSSSQAGITNVFHAHRDIDLKKESVVE